MRAAWSLPTLLLLSAACDLEERSDYLVGRPCAPESSAACDAGQVCLPHRIVSDEFSGDRYEDFRCRDRASFEPASTSPLAFCDEGRGFVCPEHMVCSADRVRLDSGPRRLVCKGEGDVYLPLDGGS